MRRRKKRRDSRNSTGAGGDGVELAGGDVMLAVPSLLMEVSQFV